MCSQLVSMRPVRRLTILSQVPRVTYEPLYATSVPAHVLSSARIKMEGRQSNRSIDTKQARKPFVIDSVSSRSKMQAYDGLRDVNLRGYFSNKGRRKVLVRAGLVRPTQVNVKGEILPKGGERGSKTQRGRSSSMRRNGSNLMTSPDTQRTVYSARSHSLKSRFQPVLKPITHHELQALFAKYQPKGSVPEESS